MADFLRGSCAQPNLTSIAHTKMFSEGMDFIELTSILSVSFLWHKAPYCFTFSSLLGMRLMILTDMHP